MYRSMTFIKASLGEERLQEREELGRLERWGELGEEEMKIEEVMRIISMRQEVVNIRLASVKYH